MIIAAQLAELLVGLGIRRVYGLPGEDHMALLDSLQAAGLEYTTAFNESSAVLMAATDAQLTGLPGVAVLSLAPGVSNGVNGLLNTYLDQIPLLVISGQHPAGRLPFVVRQGFDIERLVAPITKWQARITADMDLPAVVGKAVDEAMSGRPGPVYLELPDGVATAESTAPSTEHTVAALRSRWVEPTRPATTTEVTGLAERIARARHPALVVGGRRRLVEPATVAEFAAAYRMPVFTTSRQKGLLGSDFPFYAGTFLNGRLERNLLDHSDLVVMVNPESFDYYNKAWCFDADAIALVDPSFTEWLNPFTERHVVDPDAVLRDLTAHSAGSASVWTPQDVRDYRNTLRASLVPADAPTFSVAHAVAAALDAWPQDGYLVADAGFGKPLVAMLSDPALPDHYLASNALSTMGYAIPATVAARRAVDGPILTFLGDGSLLMRATELMVAPTDTTPSVLVALMDRSLTQIEVKQERRGLAPVGAALPPVWCAKLADAFGIDGMDVTDADELRAAVAKGLRGDRPLLIGAHIDPAPSRDLFDLLRG
jgi:acetolactate synthase I/II/III large subunit